MLSKGFVCSVFDAASTRRLRSAAEAMFEDVLSIAVNESEDRANDFHYGQRVRIANEDLKPYGEEGSVVEYSPEHDKWYLLMDDGSGKLLRTSDIELVDDHPHSWVKYQIPGSEAKWAYFNKVTQQTRWNPPAHAADVPEMLPQNARAFFYHIVHRWTSVTRAYGQLCEAAALARPRGTAALSAGASLDRQDFVAACQDLELVEGRSASIAANIFDGIDLDGGRGGDKVLTITDFHAADLKYHSVSAGAYGQAQPPIGLLLFWPELVPDEFHQRAGFEPPPRRAPVQGQRRQPRLVDNVIYRQDALRRGA